MRGQDVRAQTAAGTMDYRNRALAQKGEYEDKSLALAAENVRTAQARLDQLTRYQAQQQQLGASQLDLQRTNQEIAQQRYIVQQAAEKARDAETERYHKVAEAEQERAHRAQEEIARIQAGLRPQMTQAQYAAAVAKIASEDTDPAGATMRAQRALARMGIHPPNAQPSAGVAPAARPGVIIQNGSRFDARTHQYLGPVQ